VSKGTGDRGFWGAPLALEGAKVALRLFIEFGEAALLGQNPLVVETRQQLSPVERNGLR
jgi:hypothetical protein